MVDTLDPLTLESSLDDESSYSQPDAIRTGDPCKCSLSHETTDGTCAFDLPEGHSPKRKYCDGCLRGGGLHKRTETDQAPKGVNVNIKIPTTPKSKDPTEQRVKEATTAWLGLVAAVLESTGDTVCGQAVKDGAPQIAIQMAALSKFHPIIVKILCPVEASGEMLAWVSLTVAMAPILITVLTHHGIMKPEVAERVGVFVAMGSVVSQVPTTAPAE